MAPTEPGRFFLHPAKLHLEPADLLVELGLESHVIRGDGLAAIAEEILGPGQTDLGQFQRDDFLTILARE